MKFGIIADDNTGATDSAGMCTERRLRTVLFTQEPNAEDIAITREFDAIVLGTQARSVDPTEAYRRTREAVMTLKQMGAEKIQMKYCSTFDSTKDGNIGPSLDAALDTLGVRGTIVCPALPVNGRTTYQGYHFVNDRLLSESPLKDHPLNPMTDPDLVRWLQYQTDRKVTLASVFNIRQGVHALARTLDELLREGSGYIVTDAIFQEDIAVIAEATQDWPLVSGGSGITAEVAECIESAHPVPDWRTLASQTKKTMLVVSGSCSPATLGQLEYAKDVGFAIIAINPRSVLDGQFHPEDTAAKLHELLSMGQSVVLYASSPREQIDTIQHYGLSLGLTITETGEKIADALAETAQRVLMKNEVGRLVVSGGETSGAVCRACGFRALEVGLPVDPGVPYCFPLDQPGLLVVLKSGNFGARSFYGKVAEI